MQLNFKKGLYRNLKDATSRAGTLYITTDEKALYFDVSDSERIRIGDIIQVQTTTELEEKYSPYSTEVFYYVAEGNALLKYTANETEPWVQINSKSDYSSNLESLSTAITELNLGLSAANSAIQNEVARATAKEDEIVVLIDQKMQTGDAMRFKGVALSADDLPLQNVKNGDTYKVGASFEYGDIVCYIGDLLIANGDSDEDGNYSGTWSHVPSGYEDDYDSYLQWDSTNSAIVLRSGIGVNKGQISFVNDYTEEDGGLKLQVEAQTTPLGDSFTVSASLEWGSF